MLKTVRRTLCALLFLGLPMATIAQTYTITNLGSASWSYSEAHGVNAAGKVVGEYEGTNMFSVLSFLFSDGTTTDLGTLAGSPYAVGYGINETNQITGESISHVDTHAFLYQNGKMTDLGTLTGLGGSGYSSGHAINRAGQVAGETSLVLASTIHAALFSGGSIKDLGALGGDYSAANGINNSGIIVGESDAVQQGVTNVHAFIYTNVAGGSMVDLGTLGGNYSSAKGVNDSGTVVGEAETVIGGTTMLHGFSYQNGTMTDIGTLGGNTSSASAINSAGMIVGYATDSNEIANAFLYDGSKMINLITLLPPNSGWTNLASADGINDAGQIIGSGYLADGEFQGYLLTPNSNPPSVVILSPTLRDNSFSFSFTTQAGVSYSGQFASSLQSTNNWVSFTNITGNGSIVRITNSPLSTGQGYYRVVAQ